MLNQVLGSRSMGSVYVDPGPQELCAVGIDSTACRRLYIEMAKPEMGSQAFGGSAS
jgi:hypothetical protein